MEKDVGIANVTDDLSGVVENSLFVCVRGRQTDGHSLIPEALRRGAAAVVCERPADTAAAVYTENTRLVFSLLNAAFYGHPDRRLGLIGITGTNGKTTTAQYVKRILERCGRRTAVIGTLGAEDGCGETAETGYTTPPSDVFFRTLAAAADKGCEFCVAEVSSQALAQYRVHGASFRVGAFTNLGAEHLDYHGTVAALAEAKSRLCGLSDVFLINADDAYAAYFTQACTGRPLLYSCRGRGSDFLAGELKPDAAGVTFRAFHGAESRVLRTPSPGVFSAYNVLAAVAVCTAAGLPFLSAARAADGLPVLPGRMQLVEKNGVRICVDFAHTPAALSAALSALRPADDGRLIVVFGCGGNRDASKRPVMGAIAADAADAVILTTDNPRREDPEKIISEILAGVPRKNAVFTEPDRARAIRLAVNKARPGDTVLIAGKGHEAFQQIGEEKIPFSDMDVVNGI